MFRRITTAIFIPGRHFIADYTGKIAVHFKAGRTGVRAKTAAYASIGINRDLHGCLPRFVAAELI